MAEAGATAGRRWNVRIAVLLALIAVGVALRLTVLAPDPVEVRVAAVERASSTPR